MRRFNTAGPCVAELHYLVPPDTRLPQVPGLIDEQAYFVVHAPRQAGKTTALRWVARRLTAEGRYTALLTSMEVGAAFEHDIGAAEQAVLASWRDTAAAHLPPDLQPPPWPAAPPGARIGSALAAWARASERPLVLFLDEIDALRDDVLLSVLRQLRAGFDNRPRGFPHALALVGLRDVRDYRVRADGLDRLHTTSPFNIKVESLTLADFTTSEVAELYAQHTAETGQAFDAAALARTVRLTGGQPWLVNALARAAVTEIVPDRREPVTVDAIDAARDRLIERQDTHLDSLAERLRDPRVRGVIEPMILGDPLGALPPDDLRFTHDLGLVRQDESGVLRIANPIYREIVVRTLTASVRASIPRLTPSWLGTDGAFDEAALRKAFVAFWLQHGEMLRASAPYTEAAAHLVLMAFLQRVANGGGRVDRELAIGTGRLDLCVSYGTFRLGVEVKTWRDNDHAKDPADGALDQLDQYLARIGATQGWVVRFDQRTTARTLPERYSVAGRVTPTGRTVFVILL